MVSEPYAVYLHMLNPSIFRAITIDSTILNWSNYLGSHLISRTVDQKSVLFIVFLLIIAMSLYWRSWRVSEFYAESSPMLNPSTFSAISTDRTILDWSSYFCSHLISRTIGQNGVLCIVFLLILAMTSDWRFWRILESNVESESMWNRPILRTIMTDWTNLYWSSYLDPHLISRTVGRKCALFIVFQLILAMSLNWRSWRVSDSYVESEALLNRPGLKAIRTNWTILNWSSYLGSHLISRTIGQNSALFIVFPLILAELKLEILEAI